MSASALPGGLLPLALAWLGSAGLLCAGIVFAIHGEAIPARGLALVTIWAAVALALGLALRSPRTTMLRRAGLLWLVVAACGGAWLWWSQNA